MPNINFIADTSKRASGDLKVSAYRVGYYRVSDRLDED
jgi:hypothetical protein